MHPINSLGTVISWVWVPGPEFVGVLNCEPAKAARADMSKKETIEPSWIHELKKDKPKKQLPKELPEGEIVGLAPAKLPKPRSPAKGEFPNFVTCVSKGTKNDQ